MTIDFNKNRIYRFDKDLNLKEHKPFSTEFWQIEILPNGKILIIETYFKYDNKGNSNLYCMNQDLEIEWFLPTPNQNQKSLDLYVGFTTNGNKVFANSFNCYRVQIDTEKGQIISTKFTK